MSTSVFALIWLSPQSSYWLCADPKTHDPGPSVCDPRPRRRLPSGRCNLCRCGEEVWSAPAQVQAFWRSDNQTCWVQNRTAGFINLHSLWLPRAACSSSHHVSSKMILLNYVSIKCIWAVVVLWMLHAYGFIVVSLHSLHNFIVHIVLLYRGTLWHYKGLLLFSGLQ